MAGVHVLAISIEGGKTQSIMDAARPFLGDHVPIWADNPERSDKTITLLPGVLRCHPAPVRNCPQRNRLPIAHCSERGRSGHVHYIDLDHIIGDKYGVTVKGPINRTVDAQVALREAVIDATPMWW
jgi:magnesium transporter